MKIKDFETAICALDCPIELDEVKLQGGHVRQVNGHTATLTVVWDETGRAFTTPLAQESEEFIELGSGRTVAGRRIKRDAKFDLKFD